MLIWDGRKESLMVPQLKPLLRKTSACSWVEAARECAVRKLCKTAAQELFWCAFHCWSLLKSWGCWIQWRSSRTPWSSFRCILRSADDCWGSYFSKRCHHSVVVEPCVWLPGCNKELQWSGVITGGRPLCRRRLHSCAVENVQIQRTVSSLPEHA